MRKSSIKFLSVFVFMSFLFSALIPNFKALAPRYVTHKHGKNEFTINAYDNYNLNSYLSRYSMNNPAFIGQIECQCTDAELNIIRLDISEKYRRQGFGTKLMKLAIKKANLPMVSLEVVINNEAAIRLYEKLGFVIDREVAGLYIMKLNLTQPKNYNPKTAFIARNSMSIC